MNTEPFGYFKAEPFGWTDCAETESGAVPLYERSAIDSLEAQLAAARREAAELRQEANSAGDVLLEAGFPDDAPLWQDIKQLAVQRDAARREAAEAQALVKRYRIACTEHMFGAESPIIKAIDDEVGEIGFHALAEAIEQARREERAKVIAELGDMADNARDNGYRLAVEALHEAIDMLEADSGKEG